MTGGEEALALNARLPVFVFDDSGDADRGPAADRRSRATALLRSLPNALQDIVDERPHLRRESVQQIALDPGVDRNRVEQGPPALPQLPPGQQRVDLFRMPSCAKTTPSSFDGDRVDFLEPARPFQPSESIA